MENPDRALKLAQGKIARQLCRIAPPQYLYCPVKGRSYVSNAARHIGNRAVRTLDVKTYFPSTPSKRVFWFYNAVLRCERDIAGLLTSLTTYQGHLPTGSPLSPIMAYFAHHDLWESISEFCLARNLTLTVYIDDCTVSGDRVTAVDMWQIKRLIHRCGLRYHKEKAYFDSPPEITGVIVRDGRTTLPNRQHLKLRQARREMSERPADEAVQKQVAGLEAQAAQVGLASGKRAHASP